MNYNSGKRRSAANKMILPFKNNNMATSAFSLLNRSLPFLALVWLVLTPFSAGAGEYERIGVFINQSKLYMHTTADKTGRRYYTSRKMAFDVLLAENKGRETMYLIKYPFRSETRSVTGYTLYKEPGANEDGKAKIRVFQDIPTFSDNYPPYTEVEFDKLKYTGTVGESPLFPNVLWNKVAYKSEVPIRLWISAKSIGVFRPFGSAAIVNNFLRRQRTLRLSSRERRGLYYGRVEKGYSKRGVRMAFGEPSAINGEGSSKEQWIYDCCTITFNQNNFVTKVAY